MKVDVFIERGNLKHNNKYDYSLIIEKQIREKFEIICSIHGVFKQRGDAHLGGQGCGICGNSILKSQEEFIKKSNLVHNNKYDYSKVNYINSKIKVIVICPTHGEFEITPDNHVSKHGCSKCKLSQGELDIIKILEEHSIKYINQKKFDGCINKRKLSFDFYLPDHNVCIEYDGIQHFESIEYFGGDKEFKYIKHKDNIKNNYCLSNNIKLFRISHNENLHQEMSNIISSLNH